MKMDLDCHIFLDSAAAPNTSHAHCYVFLIKSSHKSRGLCRMADPLKLNARAFEPEPVLPPDGEPVLPPLQGLISGKKRPYKRSHS